MGCPSVALLLLLLEERDLVEIGTFEPSFGLRIFVVQPGCIPPPMGSLVGRSEPGCGLRPALSFKDFRHPG
jgi:hypothetical protein